MRLVSDQEEGDSMIAYEEVVAASETYQAEIWALDDDAGDWFTTEGIDGIELAAAARTASSLVARDVMAEPQLAAALLTSSFMVAFAYGWIAHRDARVSA